MQTQRIVDMVNAKLAGELLSVTELKPILDSVIDDINTELNANYPVFSEVPLGKADYDYFPDRYIRTVVVPGTAWKYLVTDEEGISTANQYYMDYQLGMFYMVRDMLYNIPEEYKADPRQGTVTFTKEEETGERGLFVDGNDFFL